MSQVTEVTALDLAIALRVPVEYINIKLVITPEMRAPPDYYKRMRCEQHGNRAVHAKIKDEYRCVACDYYRRMGR